MSETNFPTLASSNRLKSVRGSSDSSNLAYGRILPQAVDLEEAVLGALMLDKDAISIIIEILQADSFYRDSHKIVYEAMRYLFDNSHPIDLLTVADRLKKVQKLEEAGGNSYLIYLSNRVASAANIEYHARIISQKYIQRELIRVSTDTVHDCFEDIKDVFDMLDGAEQKLYDITEKNLKRGFRQISSLAREAIEQIEKVAKDTDGITGTPTGFQQLDDITSGWQKSDLVIVAARPGMGKTAFALALASNAALHYGKGVAFFTLEMSSLQLVNRLISMESGIDNQKLRNANLKEEDWTKINDAMHRLSEANIFIDETPAINIFELRAKCRRLKSNHSIDLICIDYLQLMSASSADGRTNREQEISTISRALKGLAKELNVPVIALSQLSRAVEQRASKRPVLSDLRESGAIEQDADIVTFLYRPDYYEAEGDSNPEIADGFTELIIAKHRNGSLDTVKLKFVKEFARFEEFQDIGFLDPQGGAIDGGFITRSSSMNDDNVPY